MGGEKPPAGFLRQGKPNVEPRGGSDDDPKAFVKLSLDLQRRLERRVTSMPQLNITQDEVEGSKKKFLEKAKGRGVRVLEDDLETVLKVGVELLEQDRTNLLSILGLALAYLETTADEREEYIGEDE